MQEPVGERMGAVVFVETIWYGTPALSHDIIAAAAAAAALSEGLEHRPLSRRIACYVSSFPTNVIRSYPFQCNYLLYPQAACFDIPPPRPKKEQQKRTQVLLVEYFCLLFYFINVQMDVENDVGV